MRDDTVDLPAVRDAFALLADETRVQILLGLYTAASPCSFSQLRQQVGVADSGRFNYHLGQLAGTFVSKDSTGDRTTYEVTSAGRQILGAVASGVYTTELSIESQQLSGTCARCENQLVLTYDDERLAVQCPVCEFPIIRLAIPPAVLEQTERSSLPETFERWSRSVHDHVTNGFCWFCHGPVTATLADRDALDAVYSELFPVELSCGRCGEVFTSVIGGLLLRASPVVAFHYDHGIDIETTPLWELDWLFEPHARSRSDDPDRFEMWIELDDERLSLDLDETFAIVDVERVSNS